jgi:general stress protein 26
MKILIPSNSEFQALARLIEPLRVAMLTHLDEGGRLVSRPMTALEMDADGALWFFTDRASAGYHDLRILNLSFSDVERSVFVSLSGRGELRFDRERARALWTPAARPWFPDGPDSPELALLKFSPEAADTWDSPHSRALRVLAMAASIAAARPVGLGHHEHLQAGKGA